MTSTIGHFEKTRALHATPRFIVTGGVRAPAPDGKVESELRIFDHPAEKLVSTVKLPAHVHALAGTADVVAAGCADGYVRVVELAAGRVVAEHRLHDGPVLALALSKDGSRVLTGGADGRARFVDLRTAEARGEWRLSSRPIRAVAVDDAGTTVFAAGDDGVIRSTSVFAGAAVREMPGHDGPVLALTHLPREGRVASGGDDGTVRLWYLTGDVEHERKGNDQDAHKGPVLALLHIAGEPLPGQDPTDRLYSASADGTVKAWRLEDRKKPRTLDVGDAVHALTFVPKAGVSAADGRGAGHLFAGGDKRSVVRVSVAEGGQLGEDAKTWRDGFVEQEQELSGARPKREAAIQLLFTLGEREARDLIVRAISGDKEAEVRANIVGEAARRRRQDLIPAVRGALDSADKPVRVAAFDALLSLENERPLSAVRAALRGKHPDVRKRGVEKLVSLAGTSPLVPGLVAEKLTDGDHTVRLAALAALVALDIAERKDPPVDALVTAFARGTADIRSWVLVRAARGGVFGHPALAPAIARALDDEDASVRRMAFALRVLVKKSLAEKVETREPELTSLFTEALKRVAALENGDPLGPVTDDDVPIARMVLPPAPEAKGDGELEPLLVAMACRTPDTALRGALSLAVLGDMRALGALLQLSREGDAALRKSAVAGLRALGAQPEAKSRAKKRLAWMLDDADAAVRAAAYDALAKLDAQEPLAVADVALRSSHEDIRARGLELLVKVGSAPEGAALLLEEAIEDESAKVRAEAFRTLWTWHAQQPKTAIERALIARFPDTRMRAVDELNARAKEGADAQYARGKLVDAVDDVDAGVGKAAFEAAQKHLGDKDAAPILAGLESTEAPVRALAALKARRVPADAVRSPLTKALLDDDVNVRTNALESLDHLFKDENGPLITGLQGKHLDLRVRAAELLALRKDEQLIDTMRALIDDKDLIRALPADVVGMLRRRATGALATLGSRRNVKYLQGLLKDEMVPVREEAARGLASSCRPGDEPILLDAMGHTEVWVRSWAAEGLARLGDVRALPVLTGTLRHEHLPIRRGAILAFAAFGPDGYGGMLQGLEDKDEELEQIVFAIVLAHDLQLLRRNQPPDFLATALSSQRAEVRFAAARALEMRTDPELFLAHLVEVLTPEKPEKVSDMTPEKGWPAEDERNRVLRALAEALGNLDNADRRYAAAQALLHKKNPRDYFRVAGDVARLRRATESVVPDTRPRPISIEGDPEPAPSTPRRGFFRKVFSSDSPKSPGAGVDAAGNVVVSAEEQDRLRRLAFGAYVGLLRQVIAGDESQRVRRDAVDRIVDIGVAHLGVAAALPPLVRALDDGHHLVRKAALAGLKKLVPLEEAQRLGLASPHADVARAVLDELAAKGPSAKGEVARGLASENAEVRKFAFELLEKLEADAGRKGSLEPLLLALASPHADLRLGVLERLAQSSDTRVIEALTKALGSDHDDLRMRAAELLTQRGDARAVDVLAAFLRMDPSASPAAAALVQRARNALAAFQNPASSLAVGARLDEVPADDGNVILQLVDVLSKIKLPDSVAPLVKLFDAEREDVRAAAFNACLNVAGKKRKRRADVELAFLVPASRAKDPFLRARAATELDRTDSAQADETLLALFADRDPAVRAAAVTSYATRVRRRGANVQPLLEVLKKGQRELVLPAGEGVAAKHDSSALVPLLLVARAGEPGEQERALLALGTLGDPRALEELFTIAAGGSADAPVSPSMRAAATEALGRIHNQVSDPGARSRIWEHLDAAAGDRDVAMLRSALGGLIAINDARSRARIESLLGENIDAGVVLTAAKALRLVGDVSNEAGLSQALNHWNNDVARECKRALDRIFANDKVKVALLGVTSRFPDIAGPAATFLAEEGAPAELLKRLPELASDDLRERIRFGLLRRGAQPGALPSVAVSALFDDDRVRARANAAFLVGARPHAFVGAERGAVVAALARAEERTAKNWTNAGAQERVHESSTWMRIWIAARKLEDSSLLELAKRRLQPPTPAVIRAACVRFIAAVGHAADVAALDKQLSDIDGGVRQAAAMAIGQRAPETARAVVSNGHVATGDPVSLAFVVDKAGRAKLASTKQGRAIVVPSFWRDKEPAVLLDLASDGEDTATRKGAIEALGWLDHDVVREALYEMVGDEELDEELKKTAYKALRRNNRRKAAREREEGGASA